MEIDTIEQLRIARNESRRVLREVNKIVGDQWKIKFKARKRVVRREAKSYWWTIDSALTFRKPGIRIGFGWTDLELPLTMDFFRDFAERELKSETEDLASEGRQEMAKILTSYFMANELDGQLKTNQGPSRRATKV